MDNPAGTSASQDSRMEQLERENTRMKVELDHAAIRESIHMETENRLADLGYHHVTNIQQLNHKHDSEWKSLIADHKFKLSNARKNLLNDLHRHGLGPRPAAHNAPQQQYSSPYPQPSGPAHRQAFGSAVPPADGAQNTGPSSNFSNHPAVPPSSGDRSSQVPIRTSPATNNTPQNGSPPIPQLRLVTRPPAAEKSPIAGNGQSPASDTSQDKAKKRPEIVLRTKKDMPPLASPKDQSTVPKKTKIQITTKGATMRSGMSHDHRASPKTTPTSSKSMAQNAHPTMQGPNMLSDPSKIYSPSMQEPSMHQGMARQNDLPPQGFGMHSSMDQNKYPATEGYGMDTHMAQTSNAGHQGTGFSSNVASNNNPPTTGANVGSGMAQSKSKANDGGLKLRLPRRKLPSSPIQPSSTIAEHGSDSDFEELVEPPKKDSQGTNMGSGMAQTTDSYDLGSEPGEIILTKPQKKQPTIQGSNMASSMGQTDCAVKKDTGVKTGIKRQRQTSPPLESAMPPTNKPFLRSAHDTHNPENGMSLASLQASKHVFKTKLVSYTPAKDSNELDLTWAEMECTHFFYNELKEIFEPYNGVEKRSWVRSDMVLNRNWKGQAFFHLESSRFEIFRVGTDGGRLRIQFTDPHVTQNFVAYFITTFDKYVESILEKYDIASPSPGSPLATYMLIFHLL